jgi:hypothetical protein
MIEKYAFCPGQFLCRMQVMKDSSEEQFSQYWRQTEVIREYQQILYTFGDMKLPYVFLAEHNSYGDRTVVRKGIIHIQKPNIVLPGQPGGPKFGEGFDNFGALSSNAAFIIRSMGLPYSEVTNKWMTKDSIEYGKLQQTIDRFTDKLEHQEDTDTGLIKGAPDGVDIALMRYSIGLMIKSAPENVRQFFEHLRRQNAGPISASEKITDEDIQRLFG